MLGAFFALLLAANGPWLGQAHTLLSRSNATRRLREAGATRDDPKEPKPVTLDSAVMKRGVGEVAIASAAVDQALVSSKDAFTVRQNFIADESVVETKAAYLKVKPLLPSARESLLTVRRYTARAWQYAEHARKVAYSSKFIADEAAKKALEVTKGWIASDAAASALTASKVDNRGDRLAAAVAGAAEPYHLALLRNQKFCEETYAKAKSAQTSAVKLIDDAKKVALKAQGMQASGLTLEARETWGMAAGMTNQAELLRQWGDKLYGQANTACGTAGGYEVLEQQAAANAAATTIMNAPMKLPPQ